MSPSEQPVSLAGAITGVLVTGVALAAIYIPGLDTAAQTAIIAFGNAVILLGAIVWTRRRVTPTENARLNAGTPVQVLDPATGQPTGDKVIVEPTPPGPIGVDG